MSKLRNSGYTGLLIFSIAIALLASAGAAAAFESSHESLTLVWGDGSGDCREVEMELVSDRLWRCPVVVPCAGMHWFQVWTGDRNAPKYGADPGSATSVVLAEDPPLIPIDVAMPGCFIYTLLEGESRFEFAGEPGSMLATVQYRDDPVAPVIGTHAEVSDHDSGEFIGRFELPAGETVLEIGNLAPGRTYDLVFAAEGYKQTTRIEHLADASPLAFTVILDVLVGNRESSWGGVKTLFR